MIRGKVNQYQQALITIDIMDGEVIIEERPAAP